MQVKKYTSCYAQRVATLLNEYLPFEEESAETVDRAEGIRFIYVDGEEVIGYIAGYEVERLIEEMPYFKQELLELHTAAAEKTTYYTSHLVVHPAYRGAGIGRSLVKAYMEQVEQAAELLITVGWVKSDTGKWDAEKLFASFDLQPFRYISNYFKPYEVYCPSCEGNCYCDSHIYWKQIS